MTTSAPSAVVFVRGYYSQLWDSKGVNYSTVFYIPDSGGCPKLGKPRGSEPDTYVDLV